MEINIDPRNLLEPLVIHVRNGVSFVIQPERKVLAKGRGRTDKAVTREEVLTYLKVHGPTREEVLMEEFHYPDRGVKINQILSTMAGAAFKEGGCWRLV